MDDARPLNGLTGGAGSFRQIKRSDRGENDLEDQGALAYERPPEREHQEEGTAARRRRSTDSYVSDEPTPELVQRLDRMRTTGEAGHETDRLRKLRGQKHYKDDPTTKFHRRLGEAEHLAREVRRERPPADPGEALERREPDEA